MSIDDVRQIGVEDIERVAEILRDRALEKLETPSDQDLRCIIKPTADFITYRMTAHLRSFNEHHPGRKPWTTIGARIGEWDDPDIGIVLWVPKLSWCGPF